MISLSFTYGDYTYERICRIPEMRKAFQRLLKAKCFVRGRVFQHWFNCNPKSICMQYLWLVTDAQKQPVAVCLHRSCDPTFSLFVKPAHRRKGIGTQLVRLSEGHSLSMRSKSRIAHRFAKNVSKTTNIPVRFVQKHEIPY